MSELEDFEKEYHKSIARVGDRSLREVEPELAHTIAVLEQNKIGLISCGEEYRLFHERDSISYLNPGRIARVLLDRHYNVNGLTTPEKKGVFLRNEIINKTRIEGIAARGSPEEKQAAIEHEWMKNIGYRKMPAMIRFDEMIKSGQWNDVIEDAAYHAIIRS